MTHLWKQIISSTLVGTRNRPFVVKHDDSDLSHMIERIEAADNEQFLLMTAVATMLYQNAGAQVVLPFDAQMPPPCAPDTRMVCGPQATKYLEHIMDGKISESLLQDWMDAAADASLRIPPDLLINFLDYARKLCDQGNMHAATADLVGERGRWLAKHRDKWVFINWQTNFDRAWSKATVSGKRTIFRQMRQVNPDRAREFYIKHQSQLSLEDQWNYIDWMIVNQSDADEPLFESLLDSEHSRIAQASADRLRRISGSQFVSRMIERMRNRVSIEIEKDEERQLVCKHYMQLDVSMIRDTVNRDMPRSLDVSEGWSFYMMSCIPPHYWETWLNETPDVLIQLGKSDPNFYIQAWLRAAQYHQDTRWASALCDYLISNNGINGLMWVLPVLPQDARDRVIQQVWRISDQGVLKYGMLAGKQWSLSISGYAVWCFSKALQQNTKQAEKWVNRALANHISHIHIDTYQSLHALFNRFQTQLTVEVAMSINKSLKTLMLRRQIRESMQPV